MCPTGRWPSEHGCNEDDLRLNMEGALVEKKKRFPLGEPFLLPF